MRQISALILVAIPCAIRADEKIDVAKGVEQAKAVAKAMLDGDFAKLVDATHPVAVEMLGGREKLIAYLTSETKKLKEMGFTLKSTSIGKPHEPVSDGKTAYVVIPFSLEITAPDAKIVTESYLLGISTDAGKTWAFVDGAGMTQKEITDKLFPTLPKGLKLPERKPPTVTKKTEQKKQ